MFRYQTLDLCTRYPSLLGAQALWDVKLAQGFYWWPEYDEYIRIKTTLQFLSTKLLNPLMFFDVWLSHQGTSSLEWFAAFNGKAPTFTVQGFPAKLPVRALIGQLSLNAFICSHADDVHASVQDTASKSDTITFHTVGQACRGSL